MVVIDVAMTETARLADYVLPAPSQYEKWEATFFNFEFPENVFHLRRPVLTRSGRRAARARDPRPAGRGARRDHRGRPGAVAGRGGRGTGGRSPRRSSRRLSANPALGALAPIVLYRTLGPTLPDGAAAAAVLWGAAHRCALSFPDSVRRAGFTGEGLELGEALFDAILASPSGVTFTVDEYEDSWRRVRTEDGRFHLVIPELLDELAGLADAAAGPTPSTRSCCRPGSGARSPPTPSSAIPRGARRTPTARCGSTRPTRRGSGVDDGGKARVTTRRASLVVVVEVSDIMQPGHISLPNGLGVDYPEASGAVAAGSGAQRAHRPRGPGLAGRHAVAQARPRPPGTGMSVDANARVWIERYATLLGLPVPSETEIEALLELAGLAAHASQRQAAPVACWLAAQAHLSASEALERARSLDT